jgi:hypothetical protein
MHRYPNISILHCYPKNISNIKKIVVEFEIVALLLIFKISKAENIPIEKNRYQY